LQDYLTLSLPLATTRDYFGNFRAHGSYVMAPLRRNLRFRCPYLSFYGYAKGTITSAFSAKLCVDFTFRNPPPRDVGHG